MRLIPISSLLLLVPAGALAGSNCSTPLSATTSPQPPSATTQPAGTSSADRIADTEIDRLPALKRISSAGAELLDLGMQHGLRTVFARNGSSFQVFYLTPDGQAEIGGVMWDAAGQNITRRQVASIDGTIPTVTIGQDAVKPPEQTLAAAQSSLLEAVRTTNFGTLGNTSAPELWMFVDPLCSYSVRAMAELDPFVAAGHVKLSIIPLSLLDYEDNGASTTKARLMLSRGTTDMVAAWRDGKLDGEVAPEADARLRANMTVATTIGLQGTPTFIWRNKDGTEGRADGIPDDLGALVAAIGG